MDEKISMDKKTVRSMGHIFESKWDIIAAAFSMVYLIAILVFLLWLLFDFCVDQTRLRTIVSLVSVGGVTSSAYELAIHTMIGGGLGGVINGIRSIIARHAEKQAFQWRFVWKYVTLPPLGIALAAIVYAIIRGGIAAFAGDFVPNTANTSTQALSAFAIGALSGYGSHTVFIWLDEQVKKLLMSTIPQKTRVPDLSGKTQEEAESVLKEAGLHTGKIDEVTSDDVELLDKVIEQSPAAGSVVARGLSVDMILATGKAGDPASDSAKG